MSGPQSNGDPVVALNHQKPGDCNYHSNQKGQGVTLKDNGKGNLPNGVVLIYFVRRKWPEVRIHTDLVNAKWPGWLVQDLEGGKSNDQR